MGNSWDYYPMKVTQAEFAKLMDVSRKTVTVWKRAGRIVMVGELVDADASRARFLSYATSRSKGFQGADRERRKGNNGDARVTADAAPGNSAVVPVTRAAAVYDPPRQFDNPANLPEAPVNAATAIGGGASDLARLLAPLLPMHVLRPLVEAWVRQQRDGWVGGPGLPDAIAHVDDWPVPIGIKGWHAHRMFTEAPLDEVDWQEIAAEAQAPR